LLSCSEYATSLAAIVATGHISQCWSSHTTWVLSEPLKGTYGDHHTRFDHLGRLAVLGISDGLAHPRQEVVVMARMRTVSFDTHKLSVLIDGLCLSAATVAKNSGVSRALICQIQKRRPVSLETYGKIVSGLKITIQEHISMPLALAERNNNE